MFIRVLAECVCVLSSYLQMDTLLLIESRLDQLLPELLGRIINHLDAKGR
jgi:hypothetical protein